MSNLIVRPIKSGDYTSIRKINKLTQIQYIGQQKWDGLTPKEKETHLVSRKTDFDGFVKSGYSFLVESNGEVIGFILAFETIPVYGEIYCKYIAIHPSHQGKGIGGLLYNSLIQTAKKNSIKKIWSLINPDNPKSIKAHQKAGFKLNDRKEAVFTI